MTTGGPGGGPRVPGARCQGAGPGAAAGIRVTGCTGTGLGPGCGFPNGMEVIVTCLPCNPGRAAVAVATDIVVGAFALPVTSGHTVVASVTGRVDRAAAAVGPAWPAGARLSDPATPTATSTATARAGQRSRAIMRPRPERRRSHGERPDSTEQAPRRATRAPARARRGGDPRP